MDRSSGAPPIKPIALRFGCRSRQRDGTPAYTWDSSGITLVEAGTAGGGGYGVQALTDSHGHLIGQFTAVGTSVSGSKAYDPWGNATAVTGDPGGTRRAGRT